MVRNILYGLGACLLVAVSLAAIFTLAAPPTAAHEIVAAASSVSHFTALDLVGLAVGVGMTTLANDSYRPFELGEENDAPVIATDIIYEGAAVGDNGSGYARPLVAADQFLGFAREQCDNASGNAGDKNVKLRVRGRVSLTVSGVAITDVGKAVYASDDDTFTLAETGNSYIGRIVRYVGTNTCVVAFDATRGALAGNQLAALPSPTQSGVNTNGTWAGTLSGTPTGTDVANAISATIFRINRLEKMLND